MCIWNWPSERYTKLINDVRGEFFRLFIRKCLRNKYVYLLTLKHPKREYFLRLEAHSENSTMWTKCGLI